MRRRTVFSLILFLLTSSVSAQELNHFQTLYDERSVTTRTLSIRLAPVDEDVRFSVTLRNNDTGFERRHEFEAPVPETPVPFQLEQSNICDNLVILLTVEYPWRHDWPQVVRTLDTFAFRASDFAFIDMAAGPLTDIALLDTLDEGAEDPARQPPILVECVSETAGTPLRFVVKAGN